MVPPAATVAEWLPTSLTRGSPATEQPTAGSCYGANGGDGGREAADELRRRFTGDGATGGGPLLWSQQQ